MPIDYKHPQFFLHSNNRVTGPFQTSLNAINYAYQHRGGYISMSPVDSHPFVSFVLTPFPYNPE